MRKNQKSQKGQALILVAVGMIGLIGFTALAIDGGNVFSERRRSQNAADTAALAGALEKVNDTLITGVFVNDGNGNSEYWYEASENLVTENMANTSGVTYTTEIPTHTFNGVVYPYPDTDCKGNQGPYYHNRDYVQVKIHITVETYFAKVIGISTMQSCVEAIARANPPHISEFMQGNSISALAPHECQSMFYNGTAQTELIGGGIFVNSDNSSCSNNGSFFCQSASGLLTAPNLTNVGWNQFNCSVNIPTISQYQTQLAMAYPPGITFPEPAKDCGERGTNPLIVNGNRIGPGPGMEAGNWEGAFPPNGVTYLEQGLYCIYGDFVLRKQDSLYGNNVTIAMMTGKISWTGSSPSDSTPNSVELYAPTAPTACTIDPTQPPCHYAYNGLLIYLPMTNSNTVTINGNSHWRLAGTILAPASLVTISGTENGFSLSTQIIAYMVKLTGTSTINFTYNDAYTWNAQYSGTVQLSK